MPPSTRRNLLYLSATTFGAALAGCSGVASIGGSGMPSRRITVADTDADPTAYPLEFAVRMVSDTTTTDDPARVRVTLSNRGDRRIDVSTGWPKVFGGLVSEETDPGLLLVHPDHAPKRNPQCPQPSGSYHIPSALGMTSLEPGASQSVTFEVWGQSGNDPSVCLPEDTFRFETTYHIGPDDNEETFEWGFSLNVESTE